MVTSLPQKSEEIIYWSILPLTKLERLCSAWGIRKLAQEPEKHHQECPIEHHHPWGRFQPEGHQLGRRVRGQWYRPQTSEREIHQLTAWQQSLTAPARGHQRRKWLRSLHHQSAGASETHIHSTRSVRPLRSHNRRQRCHPGLQQEGALEDFRILQGTMAEDEVRHSWLRKNLPGTNIKASSPAVDHQWTEEKVQKKTSLVPQFFRDCKKSSAEHINRSVIGGLEEGNSKPFRRFVKAADKARIMLEEFKSVFTIEDMTFIPWLGPIKPTIPVLQIHSAGVLKLLNQLKPHKVAGPDCIPKCVLKELSNEFAPLLTALFNQSVKQGKVPREWTQAFITPVYKKGNVHKASNYRPVSITCVICILLEHIICKHISNHMEKHNLMNSLQHGFRKRHSCETQLLLTLDDLIMSYNRKTQADVGVLEFSRAFDTIPHERLLGKLAHFGVKGPLHNWIRASLTERTMWVSIDGTSSPATRVLSGVLQGILLVPLLFLIYINDLPDNTSPGTATRLFADDCLVYREVKGIDDQ